MASVAEMERKITLVRDLVRKVAGVQFSSESPKDAALQCVLARGGTEVGTVILRAAQSGESLWKAAARSLDIDAYLAAEIPDSPSWDNRG